MKFLLTLLILPLLCVFATPQAEAQTTRSESLSKTTASKAAQRKAASKKSAKSSAKVVAKKRDVKASAKSKRLTVEARKSSSRGKSGATSKRTVKTVKAASSKRSTAMANRADNRGASLRGPKPLAPLASKPVKSTSTVAASAPPVPSVPSVAPALATAAPAAATAPATLSGSTLAAWIGIPLLASLAAVLVQRRRRVVEEPSPLAEPIDPVLRLEPTEVALSSAQLREDLLQRAEPFYIDLRAASGRKDHDYILQHCTEDMATSLILDSEIAKTEPKVEALKAELVDLFEEVNRYVASVQYTADEHHGDPRPRKVKEVWHLIRDPATPDWRLAAVEPA